MAHYNQQPFFNPTVPFTGSIQGGLQDGKTITITGKVKQYAERFHVNLQCGASAGADVALHFNPRFDNHPGYVVLNTYRNSAWGAEERKYEAPFPRGSTFTLTIVVSRDKYKLMANGSHFMEYNHRIPFGQVDTISVDGGVELASISFQNPTAPYMPPQQAFPSYCTPTQAFPSYCPPPQAFPAMPGYSPSFVIPYKAIIPGGLYAGRNITIQGVVHPDAKRFHINLCSRSGIALHFNPRFDENTVVRNNQVQGRWGTEERSGGMPFSRGQTFMMIIMYENQFFRIIVNGVQAFTFNHRRGTSEPNDTLEVDGNVTLTSVMF
ncbi:galectin-9-like isoform X2 [Brienomyrus brachyistius]|uniref:galectin-9-like isoform X2 n=1 Tax=Brienomyrus brachyistius TaxID=42636 RepID=UPI0020B2B2F7|nr:galectin-9-like isoform X2 [Brienomyrus brachyistius]